MADTSDAAPGASPRVSGPRDRDAPDVAVRGKLDLAWAAAAVARLDRAVGSRRAVKFDLAGATTCDVAAVEALARVALAARRRGVRVWFRNPQPALVELVGLVGLDRVLPVGPDPGGGHGDTSE